MFKKYFKRTRDSVYLKKNIFYTIAKSKNGKNVLKIYFNEHRIFEVHSTHINTHSNFSNENISEPSVVGETRLPILLSTREMC